jgi:hypothetical protein
MDGGLESESDYMQTQSLAGERGGGSSTCQSEAGVPHFTRDAHSRHLCSAQLAHHSTDGAVVATFSIGIAIGSSSAVQRQQHWSGHVSSDERVSLVNSIGSSSSRTVAAIDGSNITRYLQRERYIILL